MTDNTITLDLVGRAIVAGVKGGQTMPFARTRVVTLPVGRVIQFVDSSCAGSITDPYLIVTRVG